jgi:hypothetical protein
MKQAGRKEGGGKDENRLAGRKDGGRMKTGWQEGFKLRE